MLVRTDFCLLYACGGGIVRSMEGCVSRGGNGEEVFLFLSRLAPRILEAPPPKLFLTRTTIPHATQAISRALPLKYPEKIRDGGTFFRVGGGRG